MDIQRWKATFNKFFGKKSSDRWLTVAIIIAFIIMFITALTLAEADAHGLHFKDVNIQQPVVAQGWVQGVGYVWATDEDDDGLPDNFWLLYQDGDLSHTEVHIKPLTDTTYWRRIK